MMERAHACYRAAVPNSTAPVTRPAQVPCQCYSCAPILTPLCLAQHHPARPALPPRHPPLHLRRRTQLPRQVGRQPAIHAAATGTTGGLGVGHAGCRRHRCPVAIVLRRHGRLQAGRAGVGQLRGLAAILGRRLALLRHPSGVPRGCGRRAAGAAPSNLAAVVITACESHGHLCALHGRLAGP